MRNCSEEKGGYHQSDDVVCIIQIYHFDEEKRGKEGSTTSDGVMKKKERGSWPNPSRLNYSPGNEKEKRSSP